MTSVAGTIFAGVLLDKAMRYGFSAHDEPTTLEAWLARGMRIAAIPALERGRNNPVPTSAEVLAQAERHFADHCASCHANDGSGDTTVGRNLYPKAPDMRLAPTQNLSDGELFYVIRNGIRLSGMPAWADETAEQDTESWGLVRFIRHLPELSAAELAEMRQWNPIGRSQLQEEQSIENYLNGGAVPATTPQSHAH